MGDQMRAHAAISEIHQVEPRCTRRQREVSYTDEIPVVDAIVVPLQGVERATQQTGVDLGVDTFRPSAGQLCCRRCGSEPGKRKIDEKAARKYQDLELQRK
jgi:hypothetical protein